MRHVGKTETAAAMRINQRLTRQMTIPLLH
jgi:hypothetical protein